MIASKHALGWLAALAAGVFAAPSAMAVSITVNGGAPFDLWSSGNFSYDGTSLMVQTAGPLMCANVDEPLVPVRYILPMYRNSAWQFPSASDIRGISYGSGGTVLKVNQGISDSTLVCHPTNNAGQPPSPVSDGLFYQGFDDQPFNDTLPPKPAEAVDVFTAGTASCGGANPNATCMQVLSYSNGTRFAYTFEFGAALNTNPSGITVPVTVRDAYHGAFLGPNPGNGSDVGDYCVSTTPFADLTTACPVLPSGNVTETGPILSDGFLDIPFALSEVTPSVVRYVLVHRYVTAAGLPENYASPLVAAAIFVGSTDGSGNSSDRFVGDDVLFGCYPLGICGQRSGGQN